MTGPPPGPAPPGSTVTSAAAVDLVLSAEVWRQVCDHVRRSGAREAVGYLAGEAGGAATRALPLDNLVASPGAFLADPWSQFLAERQIRHLGLVVLCVYHSHPAGTPTMSAADRRSAALDRPQLVVATDGDRCTAAAWTVGADRTARPLGLRIV